MLYQFLFRFGVAVALFQLAAGAAAGAENKSVLADVEAALDCAGVADPASRLSCYDRVFAPGRHDPEPGEPVDLNENHAQAAPEVAASAIVSSVISEVRRNAYGIDFIRLENGQLWRETENSRQKFKVGQSVTIDQGILGSSNLVIDGSTRKIKVSRVE